MSWRVKKTPGAERIAGPEPTFVVEAGRNPLDVKIAISPSLMIST
jgi:hypothetical protein